MANGKNSSTRREPISRVKAKPKRSLRSLQTRANLLLVAWIALLALVATLLGVSQENQHDYQLGQRVTEPIVARVDFVAIDEEATIVQRQVARESIPNIYQANDALLDRLNGTIDSLAAVADAPTFQDLRPDVLETTRLDTYGFAALKALINNQGAEHWQLLRRNYVREIYTYALLTPERFAEEARANNRIVLLHPDPEHDQEAELSRNSSVLISLAYEDEIERLMQRAARDFPRPVRPVIVALTKQNLGATYEFDPRQTFLARDKAFSETPAVTRTFVQGEVLIPAGGNIDQSTLDILTAEFDAYELNKSPMVRWLSVLGLAGVMLLASSALWVYITAYYPRIVLKPMRGLALTCLMMLMLGLSVVIVSFAPTLTTGVVAFPVIMAAMITAIAYDQRLSLTIGCVLAVLVAVTLSLGTAPIVTMLVGVAIVAALLREVRTRSKLVMVGLYAGAGMGIAAIIAGLASEPLLIDHFMKDSKSGPFVLQQILVNGTVAAISGLIAGFVVQGVLPAIEKLFKVTTAMTLKELNDASHPLLQRLAEEAPGTYQHSLRIADMVESAAEAIGADALACRVGAMYHDIGKVNKPSYFIENQGGGPNRHEKLSPAMSLLIIVGHVKDGIEMARQYGLPKVIKHYIESHHGTSLVQYFFHAAKKQTNEAHQPEPSEFQFRYPGPKPQTREAAIMLICDGIESAARTLDDPTPVRLEQLVHSLANARLMDGQFDECPLTLQDLARIEAAVTKTLCAVYHRRIKYPEAQKPSREAATGTDG